MFCSTLTQWIDDRSQRNNWDDSRICEPKKAAATTAITRTNDTTTRLWKKTKAKENNENQFMCMRHDMSAQNKCDYIRESVMLSLLLLYIGRPTFMIYIMQYGL